ncbi:hypothetical protein Pan44_04400 [Caulifigura coniformis]|uniref:Type II toxin-antitoxin system RelE/ParE family toxin n=1 Tax=Caulifigura coniformis TaxID=2527983 RepID=A0A517S8J0_9PLAN|nr:type II toxin-antitoxin system RelE/ParE family toxin [Caulifigura coniformis]QDT52429.1 hypothetical protein Pan44_04400 [Caulifigura coniformis]
MPIEIVAKGPVRTIAFAECRSGKPAKDFLEGLDPAQERKLRALFKITANHGESGNEQKFKKERGKIWAFKRDQMRVACFRQGNTFFLTHGFLKKEDRWPTAELDRADRIMQEHLASQH